MDLEERLEKKEVIIFPSEDELYPYNQAMKDYLNSRELVVPKEIKAMKYVAENGAKNDFYYARDEETKKRLLTWLERYQIPIKVI